MLGLRWFRQGADITALARDNGISRATGYRYVDEDIAVLAEQAPDLHEVLQQTTDSGAGHMILDDRNIRAQRRNHVNFLFPTVRSGKWQDHLLDIRRALAM